MANELSVSVTLTYRKGTGDALVSLSKSYTDNITVTGDEINSNIYSIGTTQEAVPLGDIGTAGYLLARNLDITNYVEFTVESDGSSCLAKLLPGEVALFRCSAAPYAKANTAACRVEISVIET